MIHRPLLVSALVALSFVAGCDPPLVVDCDTGRFVEAGGDHWCIYRASDTLECPRLLPEEHDLPWGGYGCASMLHSPLPPDLCIALGECAGDAGP